jgi:predicted dehydrogenase
VTRKPTRPRLGFLGVGWIGRHRLQAIIEADIADAVAIADPSPEMAREAQKLAPNAKIAAGVDDILTTGVDGVVIATPSAMHAEQSILALSHGVAVFCQKPLGRTAAETRAVIDAARKADRLIGVDFSYRYTQGMQRIHQIVRAGELGRVFAIDLTFHNAYGPDKAWFYDPAQSGGGCVMDLGIHLVDLALWILDFPDVSEVRSKLFASGELLAPSPARVEDYAIATLQLNSGTAVQLACSWRLQAGRDAIISAAFYGTNGGAALSNVSGSFYDFVAERYRGTAREALAGPPDAWGGRAAIDWARRLAAGTRFDADAEKLVTVSRVLDRIYGR